MVAVPLPTTKPAVVRVKRIHTPIIISTAKDHAKALAAVTKPAAKVVKSHHRAKMRTVRWTIQVAGLRNKPNAIKFVKRLQTKGFNAYLRPLPSVKGTIYRVSVGHKLNQRKAETMVASLTKYFKLQPIIVRD